MSVHRVQAIANLFNDFNGVFLRWSPSTQFRKIFEDTVIEIVENECKTLKVVRILDVGCGHGTWISYLLKKVTRPANLKIKGIDISERRIYSAKNILADHPEVSLEVMNFMKMISSEKYDIIFFAEVLQYITEHDCHNLFQKCLQLLAKGGYIVIIDKEKYSLATLHKRILQILGEVGLASRIYEYVSYPSFRYLSELSKKVGLTIVKKMKRKNFSSLILRKL